MAAKGKKGTRVTIRPLPSDQVDQTIFEKPWRCMPRKRPQLKVTAMIKAVHEAKSTESKP